MRVASCDHGRGVTGLRKGWGAGLVVAGLALAGGASAQAGTVYGESVGPVPSTGTRTVADGELVTNVDAWDEASIRWSITDNGDGTYHYLYELAGFGDDQPGPGWGGGGAFGHHKKKHGGKHGWYDDDEHEEDEDGTEDGESNAAVSHFVLDISQSALHDPEAVQNVKLNGQPLAEDKIELGNFAMGGDWILGAVKFDEGAETKDLSYAFDSNRQPVWGDVMIKGPGPFGASKLTNRGIDYHHSSYESKFLARPDTAPATVIIPQPAALTLVGAGALMLVGRRRRPAGSASA